MARILRRRNRRQEHIDRPTAVTGNFNLHEEVVKNNRFLVVTLSVVGMLALAVFVPSAVYYSTAKTDPVLVDVEQGQVTTPSQVTIINDVTAGNGSYVEFGPKVCNPGQDPAKDRCLRKPN
jgi:hypothetical protein